MNKKARLDIDKTAKPLTSFIIKPQPFETFTGNIYSYHEPALVNNETDEKIYLYENIFDTYELPLRPFD